MKTFCIAVALSLLAGCSGMSTRSGSSGASGTTSSVYDSGARNDRDFLNDITQPKPGDVFNSYVN